MGPEQLLGVRGLAKTLLIKLGARPLAVLSTLILPSAGPTIKAGLIRFLGFFSVLSRDFRHKICLLILATALVRR